MRFCANAHLTRLASEAAKQKGCVAFYFARVLHHLPTRAIQILPAIALLDDRLQVFLPDDAVLHGVFDDGATRPAATSLARNVPSPKWAARATPLLMTLIASAVLRVPLDCLSFVLPSLVFPSRNSRKTVTTRRISSSAALPQEAPARGQLRDAALDDLHLFIR